MLKADQSVLKADQSVLRADPSVLGGDQSVLRADQPVLRADQSVLTNGMVWVFLPGEVRPLLHSVELVHAREATVLKYIKVVTEQG